MKVLDLGEGEAAFGLIIRDKYDHDNYVLLSFENLEEIHEAYNFLKKQFEEKNHD
ncbi:Hypothetical protein Nlim_1815 [Candidatus Nitrosarchaeum limnium SFB1]|uniref:Uncharacterized protein n=1 Tax=Candidatus Nitrosarchaeum limnium SFB1 TaxID=886738 RepID=F3KMR4_9ARCH|nr:Hypothetical protein Nlim_1815 [Candidatus Nitrosarchaeum limnium SFB1]